jgi:hypothetical protein
LCQRGYGFGILLDVDRALQDLPAEGSAKLLFLRDPRNMLVAWYRHLIDGSDQVIQPAPGSFTEFLQSPVVEQVAARYRRFAELNRREPNVRLLRYEHALPGWHEIAADVAAALQLPIDSRTAAVIARDSQPTQDRLPIQDRPPYPSLPNAPSVVTRQEIAELEIRFADVLAAFGYAALGEPTGRLTAASYPQSGGSPTAGERQRKAGMRRFSALWEEDPVLMRRLRPNSQGEMDVLGRRVILEVDSTGCRPVIGQPAVGERTLAVFGCSFTFGIGITAEETFCSLLQSRFPAWRVENHGVPAYSQSRNLIQLERQTRWNKPEFVTFCWIDQHLLRNVADINWIQSVSQNMRNEVEEHRLPRAMLDTTGALRMEWVRMPRTDLIGIDLSEFAPDRFYADQVCFRLFERANFIVTEYGGHFFVTTLNGRLSAWLAGRLTDAGIPVLDASLADREYFCLPDDGHPNALANQIYAERIHHYLAEYTLEQPASKTAVNKGAKLRLG